MSPYNRISLVVGLVILVVAFTFVVDLPDRAANIEVLGFSWHLTISAPWFFGALSAILIYWAVDGLVHSRPIADINLAYTLTFWPLPGLIVLMAMPFLHTFPSLTLQLAGALALALLLSAVLIAQFHVVAEGGPLYKPSYWILAVITYGLSLALYIALRSQSVSQTVSAPAVAGVSGALALGILRRGGSDTRRTWLYAALVGLVMGEVEWAFGYWLSDVSLRGNELLRALPLFWFFYLLTSVIYQYLRGQLTRAAIIEYIVLSVVGFGALWYYVF